MHGALPSLRPSEACLLKNAVQGPGGEVVARVPCDCNAIRLVRMLAWPMAILCGNEEPAVCFNQSDDVSDPHCLDIRAVRTDSNSGAESCLAVIPSLVEADGSPSDLEPRQPDIR